MNLRFLMILVFLLMGMGWPAWGNENPDVEAGNTVSREDMEIIKVLDILKLMDLVENIDLMKDMDVLIEDKKDEKKD